MKKMETNLTVNEQNVKFLNILSNFFKEETLQDHLIFLEYWLELVLTNQYYIKNSAPSDLLLKHKILEDLLIEIHRFAEEKEVLLEILTVENMDQKKFLTEEKYHLAFYPVNLEETELLNPVEVFVKSFRHYTLEEFKSQLFDWLAMGLNGKSSFGDLNKVFPIYRMIRRILEACWLIYNRAIQSQNMNVYSNDTSRIYKLVDFLVAIVPVEYIYCVNYKNNMIDLLIVIDKEYTKGFADLEPLLEFATIGFSNISCSLHSYGSLFDASKKNRLFYFLNCVPKNCIYSKSGSKEFTTNVIATLSQDTSALQVFNIGMNKAKSFFKGASNYMHMGEHNLAAFMLHQACEMVYRTVLLAMKGSDLKCHELVVLRKHVQQCFPELLGIFSSNEKEEIRLLTLLEQCYIDARYTLDFQINKQDLTTLYNKVEHLQIVAANLFNELYSTIFCTSENLIETVDDWF